jgi:uncharacterized protein (UPF0305 family)
MIRMEEKNIHIFDEIIGMTDKVELARALARELSGYSIYDIMRISAFLDREINMLPSPYRERSRPYFMEQMFGRQANIMAGLSNGNFQSLKGPIKNLSLYREFCTTESRHFTERSTNADEDYDPFHSLYYLLISCFYMFVLESPGHPVGTPFPGGFMVRRSGDTYYCAIRDKEKDVEYSICNFCPSKQDETNN